ncbi:hypothetical protein [Alkalispirochaeta sphaeroplastigenens]|uniref:hypothetical protein n=1 Tax=Alkalispirochaeta sphaeroplastigenens TaxID=1187066 RepID=UPI0011AF2F02|nr:hypothetical protein [Alkalispirochaeta sphaeroplastigenens]
MPGIVLWRVIYLLVPVGSIVSVVATVCVEPASKMITLSGSVLTNEWNTVLPNILDDLFPATKFIILFPWAKLPRFSQSLLTKTVPAPPARVKLPPLPILIVSKVKFAPRVRVVSPVKITGNPLA